MLTKSKSLLSLGLSLAIVVANSIPVFAQFQRRTNQLKQTIQSLPNGDYFYGASPHPDSIGSWYLIFRKSNNLVTGLQYYNNKSGNLCFRGTANLNKITDITKADFIKATNRWVLSHGKPLDLDRLYKISFNQADNGTRKGFLHCIQVFNNKP